MKLDVSKVLLSVTGQPLKINDHTEATLKWAAIEALMAQGQGESLTAQEKVSRFKLAQKIHTSDGKCDFAVEEVSKMKEVIGKNCPTNVTGAAFDIIDSQP